MNDFDALAAVTDAEHTNLINCTDFHHWSLVVETDSLMAAVGHPVSHPRVAAHQRESAYQTYYTDTTWSTPLFDAALAHDDLDVGEGRQCRRREGIAAIPRKRRRHQVARGAEPDLPKC
jgi:hypothetical protein